MKHLESSGSQSGGVRGRSQCGQNAHQHDEQGQFWPVLFVFLIWGLQAVGSWLWLKAQGNPVMGWDPVGHLWRTIVYRDVLTQVSPVTLFQALTTDSFRPPLFHLCTVLMYRLFGTYADVAVLTTLPFLLLLLLAVYGIGDRISSPATGVLAAFLVSVFPLIFALTRAFYVDLALTALVTASIFLLLCVKEFRARAPSLLLGLCLGLGVLTKWTYPLFVVPPLLYVLFSSPCLLRDIRHQAKSLRMQPSRLIWALLGSLILCLAWCLPNWTAIIARPLGVGLVIFWGGLVAALIYSLLSPPRPLANLICMLSLSLFLSSLWYMTNTDFWKQVYERSYGGLEGSLLGEQHNALLFILSTLDYVPRHLVRSVLSWPLALLLLFSLAKLAYDRWVKRTETASGHALWVVTLWWALPLLVFMLSINREERSWLPLLPAFGVTMALALTRLPAGWGRTALIGAVVAFGLGQWFALSYQGVAGISATLEYARSPIGPVGPLASGEYVRWPNWGWTDYRYGVAAGILDLIAQDAQDRQIDKPILGVLVRLSQLHGDTFRYLARAQEMDMELWDMGESEGGMATYPRLFLCDYLVVKTGVNDFLNPEAGRVVDAVASRTPAPFEETFHILAQYPMPDASTLTVYGKVASDVWPGMPADLNHAEKQLGVLHGKSLKLIGYTLHGDIKAGKPFQVTLYWQVLRAVQNDYFTYLKLLNRAYHVWGEAQGLGDGELALTSSWPPGQVIKDTRELTVYPGTPPGQYQLEITLLDPYRGLELAPEGETGAFLGPIEVARGESKEQDLGIQYRSEALLGQSIRLLGYDITGKAHPGSSLHIVLFWRPEDALNKPYTVFTHVVDKNGKMWAGKDNEPVDGFYPTPQWTPGEVIRDQYDIPIPSELPPGEYLVVVGMYDAATGERLEVTGNDSGGIVLGPIVVSN